MRQDLGWAYGLEQRVIDRRQAPGETGQNHRKRAFCELCHAALSSYADAIRATKNGLLKKTSAGHSHSDCRLGLTDDPQHFPN